MSITDVLRKLGNERPESFDDFMRELDAAKLKGYKIPDIDYARVITDQIRAGEALLELGIDRASSFFQLYMKVRFLPVGRGGELSTLDQIIKSHSDSFWSVEYPHLTEKYLQISSIEGEGGYFYSPSSDKVYDVGWGDMERFASGDIEPRWSSFEDFIRWYYAEL